MAHTPQAALVKQWATYSPSRDVYRLRERRQEAAAVLALYPVRGRVMNVVPVRERPRP